MSGPLPDTTRLGPVELTVTDVERAIAFYTEAIGLQVARTAEAQAALGVGGEDLLVLVENRAARAPGRHAGLYHVALLHPSRGELARAAARLAVTRTPIQGASDHGTHEAIYLADPDGNGLELAADRPRERWPDIADARLYSAGPRPLDLGGLLELAAPGVPGPATGTRIGHVHLHVGDVAESLRFYTELVGFDPIVELGGAAAFVSAGGYHHHVAFNTWRGRGVPPAPPDAVGLRRWTLLLEAERDVAAMRERFERAGARFEPRGEGELLARDPSGNAVLAAVDPDPRGSSAGRGAAAARSDR